jgi:hypothetical protein
LPPEAQRKYLRLKQAEEEVSILIRTFADQRHDLVQEKLAADAYLGRLRTWRGGSSGRAASSVSHFMRGTDPGGGMEITQPPTPSQLTTAEADLEAVKARIATLDARIAEKPRSRLPGNIDRWLMEDIPAGVTIELHRDGSARKATQGQPTVADVMAQRRLIEEKRAEIAQVRARPLPADEAKAIARQQVLEIGRRAEPDVLGLIERGSPVRFKDIHKANAVLTTGGTGVVSDTSPDAWALYFLIHSGDILDWIDRKIDEISEDDIAMSSAKKQERERELRSEILEIERDEERLIEALDNSGAPIQRRDDADPRAILELSSDLPGLA